MFGTFRALHPLFAFDACAGGAAFCIVAEVQNFQVQVHWRWHRTGGDLEPAT